MLILSQAHPPKPAPDKLLGIMSGVLAFLSARTREKWEERTREQAEIGGELGTGGELPGERSVSGRRSARKFDHCTEFCTRGLGIRRSSGRPRLAGRLAMERKSGATLGLLPGARTGLRRSARLKRILCFAAIAFTMAQDAIDNARLSNKGDNAHTGAASANEGVNLENLLQQARPRASSFSGKVGINAPYPSEQRCKYLSRGFRKERRIESMAPSSSSIAGITLQLSLISPLCARMKILS